MRKYLFAALIIAGLGSSFICGSLIVLRAIDDLHPYRVPTGGMKPTFQPGDNFYSEGLSYRFRKPQRGDIVVFTTKGISVIPESESGVAAIYIQRVIGLPGDTLELHFGDLLVNGKSDPALATLKMSPGRTYLTGDGTPVHVPEDCYFVAGDNSLNSFDSRYWGFLPAANIKGRAFFRYWPLSRIGFL